MLQVRTAAELLYPEAGILTLQHPFQQRLIACPRRTLGCAAAIVAIGADLQHIRLRLSEAQHLQTQRAASDLGIEHAPHCVALLRPEVQHALALARDRVLCRSEIEQHLSVLDGDSLRRIGQKLPQQLGKRFGRDGCSLHVCPSRF